jgi:hypothetical protein
MERTLRLPRVHATTHLPCRNIADDLTLSTYNQAFNLIYCNTIIHCLFVSILIITRYHEACFTVYLPKNLPHSPLLFFFCRRILPQWGNWGYWKNMDTQVRSYYLGRRELLGGPGQICFGGPYSSFFRKIFSGQEHFNCFRGTFPNFFTTKFRYLSTLSEKQKYFARKNNWGPTTKWLGAPRAGARGNLPPPPPPFGYVQRHVPVFKASMFYAKWDIPLCRSFINFHVVIATVAAGGGLRNKLKWHIRGKFMYLSITNSLQFSKLATTQ